MKKESDHRAGNEQKVKKIFHILLLLLIAICLFRNGGNDNEPNESIVSMKETVVKRINVVKKAKEKENINLITAEERNEEANAESEDAEIEVIENPYFPAKEHTSLKVHAEYYDRGFVDETADAEINRIKIYDEGSVYKLTIHIKPNMSSWYFKSGDIMSMYFYVTADKIYWILPYAQLEPGGKSIHFYDDDDLLVKTLDTDEKLRNKGVLMLICQEEEMQEEAFSITKEGNRITYDYSETKVNGEPGGEDLFVWEWGKGLVEFGTGFGPGPLDVHIDEICEVTENLSKADFNDMDTYIL